MTVIVTAAFVSPYSEQIQVVGEGDQTAVPALQAADDLAGRDDCRRRAD